MEDILNLDLDNAEKYLKKTKKTDRSPKREKEHKKHRKHSRTRSKSRKQERERKVKEQDKERDYKKERKSPKKETKTEPAEMVGDMDPVEAQKIRQKMLEREIEEQKRLLEDSKRDDATVLVLQLPVTADENSIYQYFKAGNCGKINDIRIIRDARSQKSKGIAYVEFYLQESILKAISMTDGYIDQQQIKVCPSQADKNRAALAAAKLKVQTQKLFETPKPQQSQLQSMIIQIGGLVDELEDFSEQNLHDLFSVYGQIEFIDLHKEKNGKNKGFAFIQYKNSKDAKLAIQKMNGFKIAKRAIKVQPISYNMEHLVGKGGSGAELDDNNMTLYSQASKAVLMQKLIQRDEPKPNPVITPILQNFNQPFEMLNQKLPDIAALNAGMNPLDISNNPLITQYLNQNSSQQQPYECLVVSNTMSAEESRDKQLCQQIKEEVQEECANYGKIVNIGVEQTGTGNVWVMFSTPEESKKAFMALNDRFFRDRHIYLSYKTVKSFHVMFK